MAYSNGPSTITTNGLIVLLDAANQRSYISGSTIVNTLTGTNVSGSLINSASFTNQNAGSFVFNGSNQYIDVSSIDSFVWRSNWTACIAANFAILSTGSTGPDDRPLINQGGGATRQGLHLNQRNSRFFLGLYGDDMPGVRTISPNTWYHVCYTCNNSTLARQIYVNGTLDASGSAAGSYQGTNQNTTIANRGLGFGLYFSGSISNVAIYNRVLSASEIEQNFNAIRGRYGI